MAEYHRVVATWVDASEENKSDWTLRVDLRLDSGGRPCPNGPSLGWRGRIGTEAFAYPFAVMPDGRVDFGFDYDIRFGETNLLSRPNVDVGQYFSFTEDDDEATYRITHKRRLD